MGSKMSIVRDNIMNKEGYTPYCGDGISCLMPRTVFNGKQFECPMCGFETCFEDEFITEYKTRWNIKMDVYEIVKKLVGPISPIGETHVDDQRFENLKAFTELTDRMLADIGNVTHENEGKHEFSIKRAVAHSSDFYKRVGIVE